MSVCSDTPARSGGSAASHRRPAQRGAALLIVLAILMTGVLYGLVLGLNEATATAPLQRSQQNAETLRQAKEALIAYAVQRPDPTALPFGGHGPGHFPCPDRNNDGFSDGVACGTGATRLGRLPWRSLGLPDLRDASGERLWYAVSRCFLERPLGTELATCANGYRVNSDVPGALRLVGLAPAQNVVAVIFAPGAPIGGQTRSGPGPDPRSAICNVIVDASCQVANYLEGDNNIPDDVFIAATPCEGGDPAKCPLGAKNDQLVVITHEDLFRATEEEVRARLDRRIAARLADYWTGWRTALGLPADAILMPFAAPIVDAGLDPTRAVNLYRGRAGDTVGLLPLTRDADFLTWDSTSVVVETRQPPGAGPWSAATISGSLPADPVINLNFAVVHDGSNREYRVTARLRNVGLTFALPVQAPGPSSSMPVASVAQAFEANGDLAVTYTFTVAAGAANPLNIAVPRTSTFSALTDPAANDAEWRWFFENNWHQHLMYVVSPGVTPAPTASLPGNCVAPPAVPGCVVIESARPADARTDARFALVLAGRNLGPAARTWTPWVPAEYFEGRNAALAAAALAGTVSNRIVERRLRGPQFNDKVIAR
jgi:hypothetical protein